MTGQNTNNPADPISPPKKTSRSVRATIGRPCSSPARAAAGKITSEKLPRSATINPERFVETEYSPI